MSTYPRGDKTCMQIRSTSNEKTVIVCLFLSFKREKTQYNLRVSRKNKSEKKSRYVY